MEKNVRFHTTPGTGESEFVDELPPGHPGASHKTVGVCTRVMRIALYSGTAALVGASVFYGPPREVVVGKLKALGSRSH